jgi:hypothetical protein
MKLPVIKPPEEFLRTMIQKIIFLRIKVEQFIPTMQLASLNTFTNIKSFTLNNSKK